MRKMELSVGEVARLVKLGFVFNEEGTEARYASGSVSNYQIITLTGAFSEYSLAHNEDAMPCVYAKCESEQTPGYAETDWNYKSEGKVVIADLFKWLESKGIYESTFEERKQALMSKVYKRKEIKAQLEAIGLSLEDIKEVL